MRLLEKSPNDRYPSAGAVKERLEAALRAETREDPAVLIRAALVDTGFGSRDEADSSKSEPIRSRRPDTARAARSPAVQGASRPIGIRRALLGFLGITVVFAIGAVANEAGSAQAREARNAGSHTLELAPERAGGLRVVATPWAHVRVDGQLLETTPFARPIPLTAGKHFVTLTHPDAPSAIEREVVIAANETMTLDVTMNLASEDAGKDAR